jgi:hypothetical protein
MLLITKATGCWGDISSAWETVVVNIELKKHKPWFNKGRFRTDHLKMLQSSEIWERQ